jgi:MFS family permease
VPPPWGFAFAANTLTVVGAQLVMLRLVAWALTLVAGQLGSGAAAVAGFAAALIVFGLAETLLSPTLPAVVNDLAPDDHRGRYNGAFTLAWTTGFLLGPPLAGVVLDAGTGTLLFIALIAACVAAARGTFRLERRLPAAANRI